MIGRTGLIRAGGRNSICGGPWLTTKISTALCGWPGRSRHTTHQVSLLPRAPRHPAISLPFSPASHFSLSCSHMPVHCFTGPLRNHILRHNIRRKQTPPTPPPLERNRKQSTNPGLLFQSHLQSPLDQAVRHQHRPGTLLISLRTRSDQRAHTLLHQSLIQPQLLHHHFDPATPS